MNTVLDPALIFIAENEWNDDEKRDGFLKHLCDNFVIIDTYALTSIYWTDTLETCLWSSPQLPPWRRNVDWRNSLVPLFYKNFIRNIVLINLTRSWPRCIVNCLMYCCHDAASEEFLRLMHEMIDRAEDVFLCLGRMNRGLHKTQVRFQCNCHANSLVTPTISDAEQWLKYVDIEAFWPETTADGAKLQEGLDVVRRAELRGAAFLYEYSFSTQFLKDLALTIDHRRDIVKTMAMRLTLSRNQAAQHPRLQDEAVEGGRERRFRVTQRPASTRIHYRLSRGILQFLRYYGIGQHDEGI
jgi:hypothetical protein